MPQNAQDRRQFPDLPDLTSEPELAAHWQKSIRTLQRWRSEGYGPAYLRIGGSIFYRICDIRDFEESMRRESGVSK